MLTRGEQRGQRKGSDLLKERNRGEKPLQRAKQAGRLRTIYERLEESSQSRRDKGDRHYGI